MFRADVAKDFARLGLGLTENGQQFGLVAYTVLARCDVLVDQCVITACTKKNTQLRIELYT